MEPLVVILLIKHWNKATLNICKYLSKESGGCLNKNNVAYLDIETNNGNDPDQVTTISMEKPILTWWDQNLDEFLNHSTVKLVVTFNTREMLW